MPATLPQRGPVGPVGPAGGQPRAFDFATPALSWTCVHNLGRYPLGIAVYDTVGDQVLADVANPDVNTTVISFVVATAGSVIIG